MPYIGFKGVVFGVWKASVSEMQLAVWELGRVYRISGTGAASATGAGAVRSTEHLGSFIPAIDSKGRRFPNRLSGKTLIFEVDPGLSIWSPHRVKIKFQSDIESQRILYEWEGRLPLNSSAFAGFKVDGTIRRMDSFEERGFFNWLMWNGDSDDSLRQRAREQEEAWQRQH